MATTEQMIRTISEYDGWVEQTPENSKDGVGHKHPFKPELGYTFRHPNKGGEYWLNTFEYATSYDWLIPVAQKVCYKFISEWDGSSDDSDYYVLSCNIHGAMLHPISDGELLKAVYDGIVFINSKKIQK